MRCNEYKENRILYVYGELKGKRKKEFKEHLSSCYYCKRYIAEFQSTLSLYRQLPDEEPSPEIARRILKRAKKRYASVSYRPRPRRVVNWRMRWAIPALASAVALFLLWILPRSGGSRWENNFEESVWRISEEISFLADAKTLNYDIDTQIQEIESELSVLGEGW